MLLPALLSRSLKQLLHSGRVERHGERFNGARRQRDTLDGDPCEGYVVRVRGEFRYREFRTKAAKYVRKDRVQTHGHWMRNAVERNGVR